MPNCSYCPCMSCRNLCVSRSLLGQPSKAVTVCWTLPPSPPPVLQTSATVVMEQMNTRTPSACATLCPSSPDSVSMLVASLTTGGPKISAVSTLLKYLLTLTQKKKNKLI